MSHIDLVHKFTFFFFFMTFGLLGSFWKWQFLAVKKKKLILNNNRLLILNPTFFHFHLISLTLCVCNVYLRFAALRVAFVVSGLTSMSFLNAHLTKRL